MDTGLVAQPQKYAPTSTAKVDSFGFGGSASDDDPYSLGFFDATPSKKDNGLTTTNLLSNGDGANGSGGIFDDDDDFGAFETAQTVPMSPPSVESQKTHSHSHSQSLFDNFTSFTSAPPPQTAEDDFGDFVTTPGKSPEPSTFPPTPALSGIANPPKVSASQLHKLGPASPKVFPAKVAQYRPNRTPIHVRDSASLPSFQEEEFPPVANILQCLSNLFLLPHTHLLDPLKGLPFPLRQRVLADPKTKEFLLGVCEFGRVAGRVVAGRRRRARPGGKRNGGMKLGGAGGVSKANMDAQKEEREVKEICRVWKEGSGRLKAAMGTAVPEMDEVWKGATLRNPTAQTCRLCALARTDVVPSLREDTDRLFWWIEDWGGHGSCRAFWEKHEKEIKRG